MEHTLDQIRDELRKAVLADEGQTLARLIAEA